MKFDINNFKILKYVYKLNYDEFGEHLKNNLVIVDSVRLVKILSSLPSCSSPNKEFHNWDMALIDSANSDTIEIILYKTDVEFTLVDMTEYYRDGTSILSEEFVKDIDKFLKTQMSLDGILDKVYSQGVEKLNKFEKTFLDNFNEKS